MWVVNGWRVERVFAGHVEWLVALGLLLADRSEWRSPVAWLVTAAAADAGRVVTMPTWRQLR